MCRGVNGTFRFGNQSARTRGALGLQVLFQRSGLRHAPALRLLLLRLRGALLVSAPQRLLSSNAAQHARGLLQAECP